MQRRWDDDYGGKGGWKAIYADKCKIDVWHLGKWKNDKPDEKLRIQRTCKIKSKAFKTSMEEIKQNQITSSDTHREKKAVRKTGLLSINIENVLLVPCWRRQRHWPTKSGRIYKILVINLGSPHCSPMIQGPGYEMLKQTYSTYHNNQILILRRCSKSYKDGAKQEIPRS